MLFLTLIRGFNAIFGNSTVFIERSIAFFTLHFIHFCIELLFSDVKKMKKYQRNPSLWKKVNNSEKNLLNNFFLYCKF